MDDEELILRYLMLAESYVATNGGVEGEVKNYRGKMKGSLNTFMEGRRNPDTDTISNYKMRFASTIEKVYEVFGLSAFRKVNADGSYENRPNRAIMDCIMLSFDARSKESLINKKAEIKTLLQTLPTIDSNFNSSITFGTSDKKQLEYRLNTWNRELDKVLLG
jgi:hypothetical protein